MRLHVRNFYVTALQRAIFVDAFFYTWILLFLPLHNYSSSVDSMIHSYSRQSSEHEEIPEVFTP